MNNGEHSEDESSKEGVSETMSRRWCEILDVTPGATADELDQAYERAISLIDGKSVGGYLMLDPASAKSARDDVERAYAELRKTTPELQTRELHEVVLPKTSADDASSIVSEVQTDAAEDCYASGVPRSAMRILAPVPSSPPTPAQESNDATRPSSGKDETRPAKQKILIQVPVIAPEVKPSVVARSDAKEAAPAPIESRKVSDVDIDVDSGHSQPSLTPTYGNDSRPPGRAIGEVHVISNGSDLPSDVEGIRDGDEINGGLIRRLRQDRAITIEMLSKRTKVQKSVLIAIEEQDFENLPARVYLRGFLTQIARVLRVDRQRLSQGFLEFVDRHGTR